MNEKHCPSSLIFIWPTLQECSYSGLILGVLEYFVVRVVRGAALPDTLLAVFCV